MHSDATSVELFASTSRCAGVSVSGVMEAASAILSSAERRLEVIAQNTANLSTPGYRRIVSFQSLLAQPSGELQLPRIGTTPDLRAGSLVSTGNPFDLALAGPGVFLVRDADQYVASRGGSFRRDEDGRLADSAGRILQQSGGGDLVVESGTPTISNDGLILIEGQAIGRIGVFSSASLGSSSSAQAELPDELESAQIRQGMVEQSNVQLGDEMTAMMAISRSAEGGARLVQTYDELIGRVFTVFGQAAR